MRRGKASVGAGEAIRERVPPMEDAPGPVAPPAPADASDQRLNLPSYLNSGADFS